VHGVEGIGVAPTQPLHQGELGFSVHTYINAPPSRA
jgi:hypothetical protein